jgi:hypothetical protein
MLGIGKNLTQSAGVNIVYRKVPPGRTQSAGVNMYIPEGAARENAKIQMAALLI